MFSVTFTSRCSHHIRVINGSAIIKFSCLEGICIDSGELIFNSTLISLLIHGFSWVHAKVFIACGNVFHAISDFNPLYTGNP